LKFLFSLEEPQKTLRFFTFFEFICTLYENVSIFWRHKKLKNIFFSVSFETSISSFFTFIFNLKAKEMKLFSKFGNSLAKMIPDTKKVRFNEILFVYSFVESVLSRHHHSNLGISHECFFVKKIRFFVQVFWNCIEFDNYVKTITYSDALIFVAYHVVSCNFTKKTFYLLEFILGVKTLYVLH